MLQIRYHEWLAKNKDNAAHKAAGTNRLYSRVFTGALGKLDPQLTHKRKCAAHKKGETDFYPAALSQPQYRLTPIVITAVNMSWSSKKVEEKVNAQDAELKKIFLNVEDAKCDLVCFHYLIKKYTESLFMHSETYKPADELPRKQLLSISDQELDARIIREFYHAAMEKNLHGRLNELIPDTKEGRALVERVFNCDYETLKEMKYEKPAQTIQLFDL